MNVNKFTNITRKLMLYATINKNPNEQIIFIKFKYNISDVEILPFSFRSI